MSEVLKTQRTGSIWPFVTCAALALLALTGSSAAADEVDYTSEPLARVKANVEAKKAILVDVREQAEWDRGHLRGAVLVPLSQLTAWENDGIRPADRETLSKVLPRGSVVYCHCASGGRALPGGEALRKLGYDARPLRTGYRDLLKAGFPKDTGSR
jgi:rhodanese-related sulfurtransferase